jgi:hypothetical protein
MNECMNHINAGTAETQRVPHWYQDIRFTRNGDTLYCVPLAWPESGQVTITLLGANSAAGGEVETVTLLGRHGDGTLEWARDEHGLHGRLPDTKACEHTLVLKISSLVLGSKVQ